MTAFTLQRPEFYRAKEFLMSQGFSEVSKTTSELFIEIEFRRGSDQVYIGIDRDLPEVSIRNGNSPRQYLSSVLEKKGVHVANHGDYDDLTRVIDCWHLVGL